MRLKIILLIFLILILLNNIKYEFFINNIISQKLNLLVVILSCKKNSHLWDSIIERDVDNMVIICGDKLDTDYKLDGKILYLNCNDYYEGLPEKMICAFDAILRIEKFKNITHILKSDDHDNYFTKENITNITNNSQIAKLDYVGQKLNKSKNVLGGRTWHFNKCSENSDWNDRPYEGEYTDWIDGGTSYILSRNALEKINSEYSAKDKDIVSREHIYEDLMIALILKKFKIYPTKLYYNIIGDKYIKKI